MTPEKGQESSVKGKARPVAISTFVDTSVKPNNFKGRIRHRLRKDKQIKAFSIKGKKAKAWRLSEEVKV